MVLELKVPHGADLEALRPLVPVFLSYVLSFVFLGIYWNNHHHLLQAAERVNGAILWANLHLLFWLSLVPFATGWMGENHFAPLPGGALRRRAADGGDRLHHPGARDHRRTQGRDSRAGRRRRQRPQGQDLAACSTLVAIAARLRQPLGRPAASTCWWRSSGSSPTAASSAVLGKG